MTNYIITYFFTFFGKNCDVWCRVTVNSSTLDKMSGFRTKNNWKELWMGRTSMIWMQLYLVNKVQLHLWFNDSLDCVPTTNCKAMQMLEGHKIPFLRFHVNYRRSISRKFSLMKKICSVISVFQMPDIPAALLIAKYLEYLWDILTENYSTV